MLNAPSISYIGLASTDLSRAKFPGYAGPLGLNSISHRVRASELPRPPQTFLGRSVIARADEAPALRACAGELLGLFILLDHYYSAQE